jgi:hypothetical protein
VKFARIFGRHILKGLIMPDDFEDDDQIGKDIKFLLLILIVVMAVAVAFWSR